ncbi:MAG: bis(5'-nucleosyl)-tetraphosphatase (symmetrical) YqeK, partial [Erysipelotrichaceae bacterium]|nr:bis(5'-nucleosyl)-tetraphosphatase (symmetrical) YqeK [Erysipelotrichaceae bacterium]
IEKVDFDHFMDLPSKLRKKIINDPELLKELVRKNISAHRYAHSLSVADCAVQLALAHHVDPRKAYYAGLLHDCTKGLPEEVHDAYFRYYDPDKINYPTGVKHSFSAKYYLKEKLNFHDKDILNAIYNHTICQSRDKLSLILYICDKREPLRQIDDDILEIARHDLYRAYELLNKDVERYLNDRKERFIKNSL